MEKQYELLLGVIKDQCIKILQKEEIDFGDFYQLDSRMSLIEHILKVGFEGKSPLETGQLNVNGL